jgi:phospholipid/cholesterol/gamma-HCH transport system ATP-binding protein
VSVDESARAFDRAEHIVVENLTKQFDEQLALSEVSLTIHRGHIGVIIGGSGAGKTTLLKILIGLDKPSSGSVFVDGIDIVPLGESQMNKVRRRFGMVFQYSALLDSLSVFDNVAFPLREHTRLKPKEVKHRVLDKLKLLGLEEGTDKKFPSELSGGMRKRVGLARALMLEPEILMYDEPTSGLDPLSSRMVDDLIAETRDRFGVTSIVISHDMAGALRIADHIYVLSQGRLVADGSPPELVRGNNQLVQQFFQASGISAETALSAGSSPSARA